MYGLSYLVRRAEEKRNKQPPGWPLVTVIEGPAGVGKTQGALLVNEGLDAAFQNPDSTLPFTFVPKLKPYQEQPSPSELAAKGVISTDFWLVERGAKERKQPLAHWWRTDELARAAQDLADAIQTKKGYVDLFKIYDRHGGGRLSFVDAPLRVPLGSRIAIEGIYAFDTVPILQKVGIHPLRIMLLPTSDNDLLQKLVERNKGHRSEADQTNLFNNELQPFWRNRRPSIETRGVDMFGISMLNETGFNFSNED